MTTQDFGPGQRLGLLNIEIMLITYKNLYKNFHMFLHQYLATSQPQLVRIPVRPYY